MIIENIAPTWTDDDRWRVDSVPEMIIGASASSHMFGGSDAPSTAADSVLFQRVQAVLARDDGSFVVVDGGTKELLLFDSNGKLSVRFGGRGGGPGELGDILDVYSCLGDSIVVGDYADVHVFDSVGTFARRERYRSEGSRDVLRGISRDCGRVLEQQSVDTPPFGQIGSPTYRFIWLEPLSGRVDTVTTVHTMDVWSRALYGEELAFALPWSPSPFSYALLNDTLVTGYGREAQLRRYSPTGRLLSIVRWRADRNPVTEEDRRQYSAARREWIAGMPVDPETQYLFPELEEYPGLSRDKPLFNRLLTDGAGRLWVQRFPVGSFGIFDSRLRERPWPSETWIVFDQAGVWLGDVEFPERFELKAVMDSRAYGVGRDVMDVESVHVLRIDMRDAVDQ